MKIGTEEVSFTRGFLSFVLNGQQLVMEETLAKTSSESIEIASFCLTKADFREVAEAIQRSRYFTNHGPLAREFESQLEAFLGVSDVVTIGNESLALLIALSAIEFDGELITATERNEFVLQIAGGLRLKKIRCIELLDSQVLSFSALADRLNSETAVAVIDETPFRPVDHHLIDQLIDCGLKVIVIAFDAFEIQSRQEASSPHPSVTTVYSFSGERSVTTLQGGAIATNDNALAERFRNVRSSYGVRQKVDVTATCNGRFSEFQAGLGLKSLARLRQQIDES